MLFVLEHSENPVTQSEILDAAKQQTTEILVLKFCIDKKNDSIIASQDILKPRLLFPVWSPNLP